MKHLAFYSGALSDAERVARPTDLCVCRCFLYGGIILHNNTHPFILLSFVACGFGMSFTVAAQSPVTQSPSKTTVQATQTTPRATAVEYVVSQDLVKVIRQNGQKSEKFVSNVQKVLPKDILRELIQITNTSNHVLENVVVQVPVPKETEFSGKATPQNKDWRLSYSIDGGKTFTVTPIRHIAVNEKGKVVSKQVPAPLSMYTDVRWTVRTLKPKETLKFSFRVQVK